MEFSKKYASFIDRNLNHPAASFFSAACQNILGFSARIVDTVVARRMWIYIVGVPPRLRQESAQYRDLQGHASVHSDTSRKRGRLEGDTMNR